MLKVGSKAIYLPERLLGEIKGFSNGSVVFQYGENLMYVIPHNIFILPELTVEECVKHLVKSGFKVSLETKN